MWILAYIGPSELSIIDRCLYGRGIREEKLSPNDGRLTEEPMDYGFQIAKLWSWFFFYIIKRCSRPDSLWPVKIKRGKLKVSPEPWWDSRSCLIMFQCSKSLIDQTCRAGAYLNYRACLKPMWEKRRGLPTLLFKYASLPLTPEIALSATGNLKMPATRATV